MAAPELGTTDQQLDPGRHIAFAICVCDKAIQSRDRQIEVKYLRQKRLESVRLVSRYVKKRAFQGRRVLGEQMEVAYR